MSETQPPPPGPEPEWEPSWDPDTGPQPARSGPRSHRAPLGAKGVGQLLAPLAAVGVVIIVVLLLIWINGRPPGGTSSTAVAGATAPTSPPLLAPTKSAAPTPKTSVRSSPTTLTSPKASKSTVSKSPAAHASNSPQPPRASSTAMATVQVLNNSRITGLAHQVAAEVANQGWRIGIIGNMQGAIPETTVYYAPGEKPAAEHLAHEFSSIQRVEPNATVDLTAKGITLVLTRNWAG